MANTHVGSTIKNLRARKKWQQEKLLSMLDYYEPNMYRLELGMQMPGSDSLRDVMEILDAPMNEMLCPRLENQPMEVYVLRYRLQQALDNKCLHESQNLYVEMLSMMNHKDPVNRQFILCQRARLMELQGKETAEILSIVLEAILQTYKEFNEDSPGNDVLLFEEPVLFHILAKLYARLGRRQDSIRILKQTCFGLQKFSIGERERDRRAVPILLTLADMLMQAGEYQEAIQICEVGINTSAMRCLGQGMPEFMQLKSDAMKKHDPCAKIDQLLRMAFAGFLLLGEREKAIAVIEGAKKKHGITVNTYGMENADVATVKKVPYARGLPPACHSIGEMIHILRIEAGLTLAELCQGICSIPTLSRIEKGEIKGHMYYIEPILQRLGRDPLLYCNFFLSRRDFEAIEIRDMIHLLLIHRKYDQAAELLEKLKTYKSFESRSNLQFVRYVEIVLQTRKQKDIESSEIEKMLLETLHMTCPKFNEDWIKYYPLTHRESILINRLANLYMKTGELSRSANIFAALITNLDRRYVDEFEKARIYAAVMFNYSTCLGRADRRKEALEVIEKALEFEQSRGRLSSLPDLIFNKAYCIFVKGNESTCLPYFVLSYYGSCLFEEYGQANNISITHKFIYEKFGLSLTT